MTHYFLGVDVGGTKTHAMIADELGNILGLGRAGPGNHESVEYAGTTRALNQAARAAASEAGITLSQIDAAGFGVGGYDWPSERAQHMEAIGTLGLHGPIELVNDAIIGLVAGAEAGWGVALVAGTGNNCRGWNADHREGRVTGAGYIFGENAGSVELALKAVQEVSKYWSQRGPATSLAERFVARVGASDLDDLMEGLTQGWYTLGPAAAPVVFAAAEEGDAVAAGCITWAAEELAGLAKGVIRQIGIQDEDFDVVMVGSLFKGGARFIDPLRASVQQLAPRARFVRLEAPPVVGAVLVAMYGLNVEAPNTIDVAAIRPRLIDTAVQRMTTELSPA